MVVRGSRWCGPSGHGRVVAMSAGGTGRGGVGGVVDQDIVHGVAGDVFGAVEHGLDCCGPDQVGQAADHAAGPTVQVTGLGDKGSRFVSMQTQGAFHGGDKLSPLLGIGECAGVDHPATAGQLPSPSAAEQPGAFHFDPGVNECRREMFGEVLQVVGQFLAGACVQVEVMDFVDFTDRPDTDCIADLR